MCRLCFRTNQNTGFVEKIRESPCYNLDIEVYRFYQLNFWLGRKTQLEKIILVYVSVSLIIWVLLSWSSEPRFLQAYLFLELEE